MKWFSWIITFINIYFGLYCLLNVLNILKSSKYSQASTLVFAILFTSMAVGSAYLLLVKGNSKYALLIGIGPWVLSLVFLLFNMLTSDYK
ncbi:MAG: hypothetical protein ABUT20_64300 [Bacteroidota bacterium]